MMNLSLYEIEDGLAQLLLYRQERLTDKEDPPTEEEITTLEDEIRKYEIAEPAKVARVAATFRMWKAQRANIKAERDRLKIIDRVLEAAEKRLKEHCAEALEHAPIPKRAASRTLIGVDGSKLMLVRNGGVDPLQIDGWDTEEERWLAESTVLPAIYETAVVRMPLSMFLHLSKEWEAQATTENPFVLISHGPDNTLIRRALALPCDRCGGRTKAPCTHCRIAEEHITPGGCSASMDDTHDFKPCPECDGTGKRIVPGARLQERGYHVQCR